MTSASGWITYNTALLKYKNALKRHLLKGRSVVSIDVKIIRKISKNGKQPSPFLAPLRVLQLVRQDQKSVDPIA